MIDRQTEAQMFQRVDVAGTTGRVDSQYKHIEFVFIAVLCPSRNVSVEMTSATHWYRYRLHSQQQTCNSVTRIPEFLIRGRESIYFDLNVVYSTIMP